MTDEERLAVRKEFRKYLRTRAGITGTDLDALIKAAEQHVTPLVRDQFLPDFGGLYEDSLDLAQLLKLARRIERNDRVMAGRQGYTCQRAVKGYAQYYAFKNGLNPDDYLPGEEPDYPVPDEDLQIHEGREYEVRGIRYERDHGARSECIEYYKGLDPDHKCRCQVCGMCFEDVYGDIGKDYIEVHHIVPVSERGGDYIVNPYKDLIPLCANCHSMVHYGKVSVAELKNRFVQEKTKRGL